MKRIIVVFGEKEEPIGRLAPAPILQPALIRAQMPAKSWPKGLHPCTPALKR